MLEKSNDELAEETMHIQHYITIAIATWNLQGTVPSGNSIKKLADKLIEGGSGNQPDIILIATQEC